MTPWTLPLLPVVAATLMFAVRRRDRGVALLGVGSLIAVLVSALWAAVTSPTAAWRWGGGLELTLAVDGFSRVMVVLIPVVALPVVAYAAATERRGRSRLLALLVAFVGAMQLLVLARDLLTLLVAWELVGAISWALIGHDWKARGNSQAAAHAFVTTRVGDLGLYLAAGLLFAGTGTFDLAAIAELDGARLHGVAAGVLVAAAAKSAQLPFAPWLFSAMAGPTPVSALLHSATLVSAGAYLLIQVAPTLTSVDWFAPTVAAVGLATALAGGVVAFTERHIKRALAGSTSAQYGLMFLAVGAGSVAAAGAQLVAHALFKALLFLSAGVAIHATGTARLDRMGLGRRLTWAAGLAGVGVLALAAVPPLGGAWSKEQIVAGAFASTRWLGATTVLIAFVTAAYASRLWLLAFGPERSYPGPQQPVVRPGRVEMVALGTLAGGSLLLGLLWVPGGAELVESLTGGSLAHGTLGGFVAAMTAIATAVGSVVWLHRRGRLVSPVGAELTRRSEGGWFGLPVAAGTLVTGPVLRTSRGLAAVDDRVIDAGVRAAAAIAAALSRTLARLAELTFATAVDGIAGGAIRLASLLRRRVEQAVDAAVAGTAAGTDLLAVVSRHLDDRAVDRTVETLAVRTGQLGRRSQGSQTGLSHHYYLYVTVGAGLLALVLAVLR